MDHDEPIELTAAERRDIEADLSDLGSMRAVFSPQGVKGVVIACQDCGANHFYEWELLRDNLEHMLSSYIQWDYGKGYIDALADTGLQPDRTVEVTQCPWCQTPFGDEFAFCPVCGRTLATVRLYRELLDRGFDERDARAMLIRAGYEAF